MADFSKRAKKARKQASKRAKAARKAAEKTSTRTRAQAARRSPSSHRRGGSRPRGCSRASGRSREYSPEPDNLPNQPDRPAGTTPMPTTTLGGPACRARPAGTVGGARMHRLILPHAARVRRARRARPSAAVTVTPASGRRGRRPSPSPSRATNPIEPATVDDVARHGEAPATSPRRRRSGRRSRARRRRATVEVPTTEDAVAEGDETFTLTVESSSSDGAVGDRDDRRRRPARARRSATRA